MIEQTQAPIAKKTLQVHASTDGVSISTTSSDNDIIMMGLIGAILLTALGMWLKYRKGNLKENKPREIGE